MGHLTSSSAHATHMVKLGHWSGLVKNRAKIQLISFSSLSQARIRGNNVLFRLKDCDAEIKYSFINFPEAFSPLWTSDFSVAGW